MRRRRTADATPTETAETASNTTLDPSNDIHVTSNVSPPETSENASVPESSVASESANAASPKPRRRPSTRRKAQTESENSAREGDSNTGSDSDSEAANRQSSDTALQEPVAAEVPGEAAPAPKRAPRRRTPKPSAEQTHEADAPEAPALLSSVPVAETASEQVVDVIPDETQPGTVEVLPEVEIAAETEGEAVSVTVSATTDVDDSSNDTDDTGDKAEAEIVGESETPASSGRRKRPRRKKGRGKGGATGESEPQTEGFQPPTVAQAADTLQEILGLTPANLPTSPATAPASAPAPTQKRTAPATPATPAVPTSAPTAEDASRRTRGLRRTPASRTGATETEATSTTAENSTTEVPPTDDLASRRVRGVRRPVVRRILGQPSGVNVAATTTAPEGQTLVPATSPLSAPPAPVGYQPLPTETLARLAEGRVERIAGVPELLVNGEAKVPLWFFVNTVTTENPDAVETAARQIRLAYESGVRFFTALAHLPWKGKSGERRYGSLDEMLSLIADNAPDAFILPRLIFSPPASWERTHENEMVRYYDDEPGDVSLSSREFWEEEAVAAVRASVEYVAGGNHAHRVFGFYLEHAEWFTDKARPYDYSEAGQAGFRAWLRTRYANGGNVALRAAWNDGQVSFDTAQVPSWPPPQGATQFFGARDGRWADYHEFLSDQTASVITRLGRIVKEASGNRSLVAVSYGYTLELARAASGHLALAHVLASPHIDILTGPVSYSARLPGGSAPLPVPIDSVLLAGKLWVSEDDTKTFKAPEGGETPDSYNPLVSTPEGTFAVHARNFGAALSRGAGVSWMDLFGEGWLDDRETWERIGRLQQTAETVAQLRREGATPPPIPDVAVLIDERSYFGVRNDELLETLVANQRDTLLRSGARVGFYLLSDLLNPDFPQAKLLLFANAFRVPYAVREALRTRFQGDGRTFAFVYAPGALEENPAELTDVWGMHLRLQPWGSKTGTQVLTTRSPLTDLVRGQRIGEERRVNPTFYAADSRADVLGEYIGTGYPSLTLRRHDDWQSVFLGETELPLPLLRGLYKLANIPVYTVDDDVAWVGDHLLCLHSAPGGGTTVYLPQAGALADLLTGEALANGGHGARLSLPPRGTRLLFWGPPENFARFGIETANAPAGLTAEELPFSLTPPKPQKPTSVVPSARREPVRFDVNPDDDALLAAALLDDSLFRDKDAGDTDDEEPEDEDMAANAAPVGEGDSANRKRRRRRRGKGRREAEILTPEGELSETEGESDSESDETDTSEPTFANEEPQDFSDVPSESDTNEESAEPDALDETDVNGAVAVATDTEEIQEPETVAQSEAVSVQTESVAPPEPEPFLPRVVATVFPDSFLPDLPRSLRTNRPSLDELLPLSQVLNDESLPPVPDELLPLDMSAFTGSNTNSNSEGEAGATGTEGEEPTRTRRRRPPRRREPRTSDSESKETPSE